MTGRMELVLALSPGKCLDVFDLHTGTHLRSLGVEASCHTIVHDSLVLCASSNRAEISLWNFRVGRSRWKSLLPRSDARVTSMASNLSCNIAFAGTSDGMLYAWSLGTGHLMAVWKAHLQSIHGLRLSEDGSLLVSFSRDCLIKVWKMANILCTPMSIADLSSSSSASASSSSEKDGIEESSSRMSSMVGRGVTAKIEEWRVLKDHILPVTDVLIAPGSDRLFSVSDDGSLKTYSLTRGQCVSSLSIGQPLSSVASDRSLNWLILGSKKGQLLRFDLCKYPLLKGDVNSIYERDRSIRLRSSDTASRVGSLAISFDGRLCAVSDPNDGSLSVWDVWFGSECRTFTKHRPGYCELSIVCDRLGGLASAPDCPELKHEKQALPLSKQWPLPFKRQIRVDQQMRRVSHSGTSVSVTLPNDDLTVSLSAGIVSANDLALNQRQQSHSLSKFGDRSDFTDDCFLREIEEDWAELVEPVDPRIIRALDSVDSSMAVTTKKKTKMDMKNKRKKRSLVECTLTDERDVRRLQEENRALKGEIQEWKGLHEKLLGFTASKVLGVSLE